MTQARDLADLAGSADAGGLTGRNIVINGAMRVAQRGTSSTTVGYGSVDRWKNSYSGGTSTGSQESLTSSDTPYGLGFRNYFRLTNTSTASGTGDYRQMVQVIEAQNLANSGWNYTSASSYVTLSFWVRSSVAGKYGIILVANDSPAYQFAFTETLVADTWTKVTKTIPGNSNLVFNNDNAAGLTLAIVAWYGTDYTDSGSTSDSWVAFDTSVYFPTDIVNWAGTSSATFDVTGVQLEVGSTPTPFEHEDFGTTLKKCERYYELMGSAVYVGSTSYGMVGVEYADGSNWLEAPFKTEKRSDSAVVAFINGFSWVSGPSHSGVGKYGAQWYLAGSFLANVSGDKSGLPVQEVKDEI